MKKTLFSALVFCLSLVVSSSLHARHDGTLHRKALLDSIPHSLSPRNDSTMYCIPSNITLVWSPGVSFNDSYYVEVCGDSSFQNLIVNDVVYHDTTRKVHLPHADTSVYWRIRTDFDTTAIWRINLHLPKAGSIASPLADTVRDYSVLFKWHPNSGGDRYELLIESNAFTLRDTVLAKDTSTHVTVLGSKYYSWKMRSLCGDGVGEWSNSGNFYVDLQPNDVFDNQQTPDQASIRTNSDASLLILHAPQNEVLQSYSIYNLVGDLISSSQVPQQQEISIQCNRLTKGAVMVELRCTNKILRRLVIVD